MGLKKISFLFLVGVLLSFPTLTWGAPLAGTWEFSGSDLSLTRLEIQPLRGNTLLLNFIQKRPGQKIYVHRGKATLQGSSIKATLRELGGTDEIRSSFQIQGKKIQARFTGQGKTFHQTLAQTKSPYPPGSTEVFFGDRPSDLNNISENLKIFKAIEMALAFEFQNKEAASGSTLDMGLIKVKNGTKISATVKAKKSPKEPNDLMIEKLVLNSSESIRIADKYLIKSVTINEKGHIALNIDRFPDLTITQIEKKSNGDIKIHIKNFPDVTIKKDGKVKLWGFIPLGKLDKVNIPEWPLDLKKLLDYFQSNQTVRDSVGNKDLLEKVINNIGKIDYKLNAVGDPHYSTLIKGVPVKTNALSVDFNGKLAVKDGKIVTSEEGGKTKVHIEFKDTALPLGLSEGKIDKGTFDLEGVYKMEIPLKKEGGKLALYFDGKSSYSLSGGKAHLVLPDDTSVFLEGVEASGSNRILLKDIKNGLDGLDGLEIRDGTLHLTTNGPAKIESVNDRGFYYGNLPLDNSLVLDSRYDLKDGELKTETTFEMVTEVSGPGVLDALKFKPLKNATVKTTLKKGSRVKLNMDKVTTSYKLGESLDKLKVDGRGAAELDMAITGGDASYENFRALMEGDGTINGASNFEFHRTPEGVRLAPTTRTKITSNINLKPGTRLSIKGKDGNVTNLTIQGNQSKISFTVDVAVKDGKPYFREVRNADVVLEVGDIEARVLGLDLTGRGKKTLVLKKGTIRFLDGGIDLYGNLSVNIEGTDDTPVLSVRWN